MMEIKTLQTFHALADELSFSRTAERLNYAQSSVTAQIQQLEQELGVHLFERLGKRIRLTSAGERLLVYADQILRLAAEAQSALSVPSGTLTIGVVESLGTYGLAPVVAAFRSQCPGVDLAFRTGICGRQVLRGELDLAFTLEEIRHDDGLVFEALREEPMLVVTHPGNPLVGSLAVQPGDLDGETTIVTEARCSYRTMFEFALETAGLRSPKVEFASIEAIKQCVIAGLGVTLLPRMAVKEELRQGLLAALPWSGPDFPVATQMCWHKDKWFSPALQAFVDVTRDSLQPSATEGKASRA